MRFVKPRKLTPRDMALGIGRKLTDRELRKHLTRPMKKPMDFDKAIQKINNALKKAS